MADLHRCYLGFLLPQPAMDAIKNVQFDIKRRAGSSMIKWTPPGEIAISLVALGEINASTAARVQGLVTPIASRTQPMSISIEGIGASPNVTMPKTAWVGLGGEIEALDSLRQALQRETTPFRSGPAPEQELNIEIGRLRTFDERARTEMGRAVKMARVGHIASVDLKELHVLSSRAGDHGPRLFSMLNMPLGKGDLPPSPNEPPPSLY